jgi:outer membrane protein assembly factor BamB
VRVAQGANLCYTVSASIRHRRSLAYSAIQRGTALNTTYRGTPDVLWSVELNEPPTGQMMIAGPLLLVATQVSDPSSQRSTLRALSLENGSVRWQHPFKYALVSGLVVSHNPAPLDAQTPMLVLVSTTSTDLMRGEGAFVALDATTGEERYRWAPGVQRISAPSLGYSVQSDDLIHHITGAITTPSTGQARELMQVVCVTTEARKLTILDAATGAVRAEATLEASASLSAPVLAGEVVAVPCRGPHLLAVGLDGRLRWRFDALEPSDAWLDKSPVIVDEHLFAVLTSGVAVALRVADGTPVWQVDVGPSVESLSPPVTDGERLFVGARDGLYALDLADGHILWTFPTLRRIVAAPVAAQDVVYATCHDHHLYALDRVTGEELWRHKVDRRIEVSPALARCGEPARPCVLTIDRSGTLTIVACPSSARERESRAIGIDGELLEAAEMSKAAGRLERAAEQYEAADTWQQAAEMWAALGRPLKQAEALERHARSLGGIPCSDKERAVAWDLAAQAFEAEGEDERADICRREKARCLHQPIITMDVQFDEGLVLDAWSTLQFIVRNGGYGPARNLVIRASGDQFEGQVTVTREFTTLRAGRERRDRLDVRPRQYGNHVPLRISLEYEDHVGKLHFQKHTIHLAVARSEAMRRKGETISVIISGQDAEEWRQREMASLSRRLAECRANLLLIQERKDQFVMEADIPLDLIKRERKLEQQIVDLEIRWARLKSWAPSTLEAVGPEETPRDQ